MYKTKNIFGVKLESSYVIINTLSGAVDIVNNELAEYLLYDNLVNEGKILSEWKSSLFERGYLFEAKEKEEQLKNEILNNNINLFKDKPLLIVLYPTLFCNLNCPYCYIPNELRDKPEVMSNQQLNTILKTIPLLKEKSQKENVLIELMGGEPLLPQTKNIVNEVISRSKGFDYKLSIITNGTYLYDFIPLFIENKSVIHTIQVTLDGTMEIHDNRRVFKDGRGSFKQIIKGIEFALEKNFSIVLRINVDKENIDTLDNFVNLIEDNFWTQYDNFRVDIAPVTDYVEKGLSNLLNEAEMYDKISKILGGISTIKGPYNLRIFKILHHLQSVIYNQDEITLPIVEYCEAMQGRQFIFSTDGNIFCCPEATGDSSLSIGKYSDNEFSIDWNKWKSWTGNIYENNLCNNCNINTFCGGGCPRRRIKNGQLLAPNDCSDKKSIISDWVLAHEESLIF